MERDKAGMSIGRSGALVRMSDRVGMRGKWMKFISNLLSLRKLFIKIKVVY